MDYSPLDSSVCGISQASILECVAISFFMGSSWPRDGAHIPFIGRQIFYPWATRETPPFFSSLFPSVHTAVLLFCLFLERLIQSSIHTCTSFLLLWLCSQHLALSSEQAFSFFETRIGWKFVNLQVMFLFLLNNSIFSFTLYCHIWL